MSREAAELARNAAAVLEQRGHCKGSLYNSKGQVCLWGAIKEAAGVGEISTSCRPDVVALRKALWDRLGGMRDFPGAQWNDQDDTTEQDVTKMLLQVADELELQ